VKRYCIKSRTGRIEYFDIISESEEGYKIRLTRIIDGDEKNIEESMTRSLFDMCVQSGYIFQMEESNVSVA
jgi:predicted transcriptional regulator